MNHIFYKLILTSAVALILDLHRVAPHVEETLSRDASATLPTDDFLGEVKWNRCTGQGNRYRKQLTTMRINKIKHSKEIRKAYYSKGDVAPACMFTVVPVLPNADQLAKLSFEHIVMLLGKPYRSDENYVEWGFFSFPTLKNPVGQLICITLDQNGKIDTLWSGEATLKKEGNEKP